MAGILHPGTPVQTSCTSCPREIGDYSCAVPLQDIHPTHGCLSSVFKQHSLTGLGPLLKHQEESGLTDFWKLKVSSV